MEVERQSQQEAASVPADSAMSRANGAESIKDNGEQEQVDGHRSSAQDRLGK